MVASDLEKFAVPAHLIDPRTGTLSASPPSRDWLVQRLAEHRDSELRVALAGCEALFDVLFQHLNFSGVSFARHDLRGMGFEGCDFSGCSFAGALIDGADFRGARVSREQLGGAKDWSEAVMKSLDRVRRPGNSRVSAMKPPLHPSLAVWSEIHFAPEMILVPALAATDGLRADEKSALGEGRLAISIVPVQDFERALHPEAYGRRSTSDGASARAGTMGTAWRDVDEYLTTLNEWLIADYALPSPALLRVMRSHIKTSLEEFARDDRGPRRWLADGGDFPFEPYLSHMALPFHVVRLFAGAQ